MPGHTDPPESNPTNPTQSFHPDAVPDTVNQADPNAATGAEAEGDFSLDAGDSAAVPTVTYQGEQKGRPKAATPARLAIPGYEVLGVLGRGGMGIVFKARQIKADRLVALKFMLGADDPGSSARARFDREAQAVARLQHPNIVQVFEVGEHDGKPFFSLEYVAGGTLADKVRQHLLPPRETAAVVRKLAVAMHDAHQHQVIHRDLKPGNVLMTPEGEPKVADFGLAKKLEDDDSGSTRAGTVVGTPSYMAPEQARGDVEHVGPPADIYALGAILYELLAGRPPFKGATIYETVEQVQNAEPIAPSTLQPNVPGDLETICLKCLQKDPAKRYGSAAELADDVGRYLDGVPILARPIGGAERLWRWCRRNKKLAGLTGTAAALLLCLAGGGVTAAVVFRKQRDEVRKQERRAVGRLGVLRTAYDTFVIDVPAALDNAPFAGEARDNVQLAISRLIAAAEDQADDEGIVQRGQVGILVREGSLLMSRREFDAAGKKLEEARAVAEAAAQAETKEKDKAAGNLAVVFGALAELAALRRQPDKAIEWHHQAIALRKGIVEAPQTGELPPADARASLGTEYAMLAGVLRTQKADPTAALTCAEQGEALLREVVAGDLSSPRLRDQHRTKHALALLEVGRAALALGRHAEGRKAFEAGIGVFQALARTAPRNFTYRQSVAVTTAEYGDELLMRLSQPAEARRYYAVAVEEAQAMARSPEIVYYQQSVLARDHYRLATAALKAGDADTARKHYAACLAWRESLLRDLEASPEAAKDASVLTTPRLNLMLAQARCGQHEAAAAMAARLLAGGSKLPNGHDRKLGLLIAAAWGFSLASETQEPSRKKAYLSEAVKALTVAIDSGYRDLYMLEHDPDLDPLRASAEFAPEYQKLVQRLRAGRK